ncbi:MAG: hypothetical protein ACK55I_51485, partial [bacterium]
LPVGPSEIKAAGCGWAGFDVERCGCEVDEGAVGCRAVDGQFKAAGADGDGGDTIEGDACG